MGGNRLLFWVPNYNKINKNTLRPNLVLTFIPFTISGFSSRYLVGVFFMYICFVYNASIDGQLHYKFSNLHGTQHSNINVTFYLFNECLWKIFELTETVPFLHWDILGNMNILIIWDKIRYIFGKSFKWVFDWITLTLNINVYFYLNKIHNNIPTMLIFLNFMLTIL